MTTTPIVTRVNAYVGHNTPTTPERIRRALAASNSQTAGARILAQRQATNVALAA